MKTSLTITLALQLTVAATLEAQSADTQVIAGRAFLVATNLIAANNCFSNAVVLSPNHPTANFFYAATRLLVLPSQPAGSNFLNQFNMPAEGRSVYGWTAQFPTDTNGVPLAPVGANANQAIALLRTNVLPALVAAGENLAKITDPYFALALSSNETRTAAVTLDAGDILMLRAMLHAAEYFVYTTYSWNLDVQLATIRALYTNEQLSIERVLMDHPQLLTFATTNDLEAAKQALVDAVDGYLAASQTIRDRWGEVTRLFNYDAAMAEDEQAFRVTLRDVKNSLTGAVALTVATNVTLFAGAPFDGAHSIRSFLPDFQDNGFVLGTLPDPTFGGAVYGLVPEELESSLGSRLASVPSIAPTFDLAGEALEFSVHVTEGRDYLVEVSTDLLTWEEHSAFSGAGSLYVFRDPGIGGVPRRFYRIVDRTLNTP